MSPSFALSRWPGSVDLVLTKSRIIVCKLSLAYLGKQEPQGAILEELLYTIHAENNIDISVGGKTKSRTSAADLTSFSVSSDSLTRSK
mmetsp:Transcript_20986/g.30523  ORF Transcript_20986/g.30523 Transcript_20986/m.30523 type:complete len:88 (-) Transcript_20986:68-331(-)